jgi:hypothetical protein
LSLCLTVASDSLSFEEQAARGIAHGNPSIVEQTPRFIVTPALQRA